jgi:hypothetical protein
MNEHHTPCTTMCTPYQMHVHMYEVQVHVHVHYTLIQYGITHNH